MASDILDSFKTITDISNLGHGSTDRMQERWVKDVLNGDFERRQQEISKIHCVKERRAAVNREGGTSYTVCIALYLKKRCLLTRLIAYC